MKKHKTYKGKYTPKFPKKYKGNYKNIYLYSLSNMPERGWLQGCDYCGSITSKIILIYQKYYDKKNYYFWLIHNKYIDDANCKLLDINELFDIKPYYILSQYHQSIKINNKRVRLNEINKLLTR